MSKVIIATDKAPAAIGTYSQAVKIGTTVYLSGQIPLDPETMELVSEDFQHQAEQVFKNLAAVCEAAGGVARMLSRARGRFESNDARKSGHAGQGSSRAAAHTSRAGVCGVKCLAI